MVVVVGRGLCCLDDVVGVEEGGSWYFGGVGRFVAFAVAVGMVGVAVVASGLVGREAVGLLLLLVGRVGELGAGVVVLGFGKGLVVLVAWFSRSELT